VAFALALTAGLGAAACGNGANSVDACRQLESARCVRAQSCGLDLEFPLHEGTSAADAVTACQLYYQDACLHGLVTPLVPTSKDVSNCLAAIQHGDCNAVVNPQDNAACAWLNPPDSGVEAGVDAAKDAAVDTYVVVVVTVDAGVDATDAGTCDQNCESQCVGDPICVQACGC
jgi:hypothetical protein